MKKLLAYLRKIPLWVKIIALFVPPVGTTMALLYYFADSIVYRSHLEYELDNKFCEETVKKYNEFILTKHVHLGANSPARWDHKRQQWKKVNNSNFSVETKAEFLAALRKQSVNIYDDKIIDNYKG